MFQPITTQVNSEQLCDWLMYVLEALTFRCTGIQQTFLQNNDIEVLSISVHKCFDIDNLKFFLLELFSQSFVQECW